MENDNNITQLLMEILKFSGENGFLFEIKNNDDEPYFKIEEVPEKTVTISVPDFKDENLFSMLEENFEKLKNLSK